MGYRHLTPACAGFVERKRSELEVIKSTFNSKIFYAGCLSLSAAVSAQLFTFQCVSQPKIVKNITRALCFAGTRSAPKKSSSAIAMISSMSVSICNISYARQASSGKMTFFRECFSFSSSFKKTLLPSGIKFCHKIQETLRLYAIIW